MQCSFLQHQTCDGKSPAVVWDALGSPILAAMIISAFIDEFRFGTKHRRLPQRNDISHFTRLNGTNILTDAMTDCRVNGILTDVSLTESYRCSYRHLRLVSPLYFHLMGCLPGSGNDFAPSMAWLSLLIIPVTLYHAGYPSAAMVSGQIRLSANDTSSATFTQVMTYHQHIKMFHQWYSPL